MKNLIIYKSNTGFTKEYAEMLARRIVPSEIIDIKKINKKKLKVGEDVGVFALGKSQTDYIFTPKLSYAKQDYKLIGSKAVEMLINQIESKDVMHCVLIKSKLRIHSSIRKPNK